jgi:flagellar L-ring protein precursor FlgH
MRLVLTALFTLAAFGLSADSVWPVGYKSHGNNASLVADQRALNVGDLVTVQVIENASAQQNASTQLNKQANVAGGAGLGSWGSGSAMPVQGYGVGAQESMTGGGSTARGGKLIAMVSARVVSVLSNGNLYIEGRRTIQVNEDKQHIYLSGIIRPRDVGPNNLIASSAISDAQIRYEGRGPLAEKNRQGVFTRILDWLGIL